jgi:dephospho-CoA kinase
MGYPVYDTDKEAKNLILHQANVHQQIEQLFGKEVFADGVYQTAWVAQQVFANPGLLAELNAIVHPAVREDFRRWAAEQRSEYVILESAILFESGFDSEVDTTIAVLAPLEERLRRTVERDGVSREDVLRRISHQLSDDELHSRADRTIVNLRRDYLESDAEQLHKTLLYEARR